MLWPLNLNRHCTMNFDSNTNQNCFNFLRSAGFMKCKFCKFFLVQQQLGFERCRHQNLTITDMSPRKIDRKLDSQTHQASERKRNRESGDVFSLLANQSRMSFQKWVMKFHCATTGIGCNSKSRGHPGLSSQATKSHHRTPQSCEPRAGCPSASCASWVFWNKDC